MSINHRGREGWTELPLFLPPVLEEEGGVIPTSATRAGSEKDAFLLSSKDDATQFPILRWSLARPVDGISTLGLTRRRAELCVGADSARRYVALVLSPSFHFSSRHAERHWRTLARVRSISCSVLPLSCCPVWDGGLRVSPVTGCSGIRRKDNPHSDRHERPKCRRSAFQRANEPAACVCARVISECVAN